MTLSEILQAAVWICTGLLGLCYTYQAVYLLMPLFLRKKWDDAQPLSPTFHCFAVLIAARNEETVLPHLLESIREQEYPADMVDIYVAADNCTDRTAEAAVSGGAVVYERENRVQVGKGYALDWLLGQMKENGQYGRYDGFLILDADNLLSPDYIAAMNRAFAAGDEVITGYRNSKNFGENWISSGYGLWYLHESGHLNRTRHRLGVSCGVSGTGFLLRRSVLDRLGGWPFHTLTEDIQFTTDTILSGGKIAFCRDAVLYDEQPEDFATSVRQRIRWVQGGIQVSLRYRRAYLKKLFCLKGPARKQACLECLTLSFWGYGAMILLSLLQFALTWAVSGIGTAFFLLLSSAAGCLCSLLAMGLITALTENSRIRCSRREKVRAVLTFPVFMLSYLIPAVLAFVTPREWKPIRHTRGISLDTMLCRQRKKCGKI